MRHRLVDLPDDLFKRLFRVLDNILQRDQSVRKKKVRNKPLANYVFHSVTAKT